MIEYWVWDKDISSLRFDTQQTQELNFYNLGVVTGYTLMTNESCLFVVVDAKYIIQPKKRKSTEMVVLLQSQSSKEHLLSAGISFWSSPSQET